MAPLHPTCGRLSLERASKLIAFLDMFLGLVGVVWFVYMLGRYDIISLDAFEADDTSNSIKLDSLGSIKDDSPKMPSRVLATNHKAISLSLSGLFTLINLTVFVVLLVGVHRKSMGLCLTWFYIRCTVIVFKIIIFIMYLIAGRPLFSQIPFIIFMLVHIYGLWVVNSYIEELRITNSQRDLEESRRIEKEKKWEKNDANEIERVEKERKEVYHDNQGFHEQL